MRGKWSIGNQRFFINAFDLHIVSGINKSWILFFFLFGSLCLLTTWTPGSSTAFKLDSLEYRHAVMHNFVQTGQEQRV